MSLPPALVTWLGTHTLHCAPAQQPVPRPPPARPPLSARRPGRAPGLAAAGVSVGDGVGPAEALAPAVRSLLERAMVTLMVMGVSGDVPDLVDIRGVTVRNARASLKKRSVFVEGWSASTIKAAAWLVQFIAPPRDKDDVRHMADIPRRRHAFGLLRHHLLVVAGARDVHESFGNYEMFVAGLFDVAELFEDVLSGARIVYARTTAGMPTTSTTLGLPSSRSYRPASPCSCLCVRRLCVRRRTPSQVWRSPFPNASTRLRRPLPKSSHSSAS